ncbi:MAG: adenosine-specific kinase [Promethearchaeota archaeon]
METEIITIENPKENQVMIGQGNFSIFATDEIFRSLLTCAPQIKAAVAMNEAVPKLTRVTGNSDELKDLTAKNCLKIGAGHVFVIMMDNAFPVNVLPVLKAHSCVANLYVASANPIQVIIAKTDLGKAILGVVDGADATAIENDTQKAERRELVAKIGYDVP